MTATQPSRQSEPPESENQKPHPHPLANEMTDQAMPNEPPQTEELEVKIERETVVHEVETPASAVRKRELLRSWLVFVAWSVMVVVVSLIVAAVRGGYDWVAMIVLVGIPLGLAFLFPVWMAFGTKSSQDEQIRRLAEESDQ